MASLVKLYVAIHLTNKIHNGFNAHKVQQLRHTFASCVALPSFMSGKFLIFFLLFLCNTIRCAYHL